MAKKRGGKSKINPELVESLDILLRHFHNSPRYEFFSNLPLAHFAPEIASELPDLRDLPMSELVQLGAGKVAFAKNCNNAILSKLIQLLKTIGADAGSEGRNEARTAAGEGGSGILLLPPAESKSATALRTARMLGNAQAVVKLTGALNAFRASNKGSRILNSKLGEFWEEGWPRAPFEECLTFQQLLEMDVEAMLKKRSLGPAKVEAIIKAIEKGLELAQPNAQPVAEQPATLNSEFPRWNFDTAGLPAFVAALLRDFENRAVLCHDRVASGMARIIAEQASPGEYLTILLSLDLEEPLVAALLKSGPETVRETGLRVLPKLALELRKNLPETFTHWDTLLAGSGISLRLLIGETGERSDFYTMLCRIFLKALGANDLAIFGVEFKGCVVRNPVALETMINAMLGTLPRSDNQLREDLRAIFPWLPIEELLAAFARVAILSASDGMWRRK